MKLAKGGQLRDQEWRVHASTTGQIARIIADLRHLDERHKKLLEYCSYWHDIGKKVMQTYKGKHKLAFEICFKELKSENELSAVDEDILKIVAHLILRHHYTSKKDIEELTKIYVPPDANIDFILRNLRASDWLASKDQVNLAELDRIINQVKPLGLFAYTISREGVLAGKVMDIIDEVVIRKSGKGVYYHNGSVFIFQEGIKLNLSELKKEIKNEITNFLDEIFESVIGVRGNPRGIVISPISELNSKTWKKSEVWERILERFHTKLSTAKNYEKRRNAYFFVQKAIFEIFAHFENTYSLEAPSLKFHPIREVIKPILPDIESELKDTDLNFDELTYDDLKVIGKGIYDYIERIEKNRPEFFEKESLVDEATESLLNSITFLGDKPEDIQETCLDWYEHYLEVAKEKGIGKRDQKEFCFICGAPTTFSFKAAIAQKIKISKIFSNRRPALAKGIDTVKICPSCVAEVKFLDNNLPSDVSSTVFLYIEKPVTTRPPYIKIKEEFLDQLGILNQPYYAGEFENIRYATSLFFEESQARWAVGTNHFYVIFGDFPRGLGTQETMLYLLPFMYSFIKRTGFSARVDVASNMDYKPVYRLLEVPPLAEEFTAPDFEEPNGRLYRNYVLPTSIWLKLGMGNIIDFVKKFSEGWSHFFARALQDRKYRALRKYLQETYPIIKEVYA